MADLGDLGIWVKIDDKELTASVNKMQKEFVKTGQAFEKGINEPLAKNWKVTKEATQNMNRLDKSIDKTTKSTKGLTSSFQGFLSKVGLVKSKQVDRSFDEASRSADKAKDSIWGLSQETQGVAGAFGKLWVALWGLTAIWAGVWVAVEQESFMKQLALQTGATDEEVQKLNKSFLDLQKGGFLNLQDNVQVLSSIKKELGLVWEEATDVATRLLSISRVFNKDINETTRASTALVKTFGISAVESADILTVALQKTGDQYDDLLDSINEYSAKAADAGLSVDEFVSNLIQGTQAGIRNTDELADVQREFTTRIIDGSDKTAEALGKLGIDYNKLEEDLRSGAISAWEAQALVAQEILNVEDKIDQASIATDLFGTRFDDNGKIILETLADTQSELWDTEWASADLAKEFKEWLWVQFRQFQGQVNSLATKWIPALSSAMALLQKAMVAVEFIAGSVGLAFDALKDKWIEVYTELKTTFSDGLAWINADFAKRIDVSKWRLKDLVAWTDFFEKQAKENSKIYDDQLLKIVKWNAEIRKNTEADLKANREARLKEINDLINDTRSGFEEINAITSDLSETGAEEIAKNTEKTNAETFAKAIDRYKKSKNDEKEIDEETQKEIQSMREEFAKEQIKTTRTVYRDFTKQLDKAEDAFEEFSENSEEFSRDIQDNIREINNDIKDLTESFEEANEKISGQEKEDLAKRWVEANEEILAIDKEIAELQAEQDRRHEENENFSYENQQKILELEEERNRLIEERKLIEWAVWVWAVQAQEEFEGLSEAEKIQKEAEEKRKANQEEFNAEKKKLEDLQKINDFFNQQRDITQANIDKLRQDERFLALSEEEQRLILQLANEKALLTKQKNEAIQLQQAVADATIALSNEVKTIQEANLQDINSEYDDLIAKIEEAIAKQQELAGIASASETATPWFATWGYTGEWGVNEVAGVVHKWEWVAPQWQVNQNQEIFKALEGQRLSRWSSSVSNTKNQTNNITVNSEIDLKSAFDYLRWKN